MYLSFLSLPIIIGAGLPETPTTASVQRFNNSSDLAVELSVESHANDAGSANETLIIDGETRSLSFEYSKALNQHWRLSARANIYQHTAGGLDDVIDQWHSAFGLDDGDRSLFEPNQLDISYEKNGVITQIQGSQSGLGDAQIGLNRVLFNTHQSSLDIAATFTLPTGSSSRLTGSDKLDAALSINYAKREAFRKNNLNWFASIGALVIGDDELFGIQTRSNAVFATFGGEWRFKNAWAINAQLDSHTAIFDSDIPELSDPSLTLNLGTNFYTKHGGYWQIRFSEDLSVNRSADFGLAVKRVFSF